VKRASYEDPHYGVSSSLLPNLTIEIVEHTSWTPAVDLRDRETGALLLRN